MPDGSACPVEVGAEEHILDAARRAGLNLPSLCEQGWCTTYAARVLEGEVDQSDSRRYFDEDRKAGFALLCTGKPLSTLKLLSHQSTAMRRHRDENNLPVPGGAGRITRNPF